LQSAVLPSVDGSTSITLQMPEGFETYTWKNAATGMVIGSDRTIAISTPGVYVANVAEFGGCSSLDSSPFTVVNANGANAPDRISNLQIVPVGLTSLKL